MSIHVEERGDGHVSVFIDGDLQFDTSDEALYHENLALPALSLAARSNDALRVLICGGGDGLALRECLHFPGVAHVDLVDYAPEMVALGRTRLAPWNDDAFSDSRVNVHIADAWDFLDGSAPYDVILCDFTVPRRPEDARVFTREWYERVAEALAPDGCVAANAVSPQTTPDAFWCLRRTVRAAGLSAVPYRVCPPSFRAQGYGVWAFLLAAHRPLTLRDLRDMACPVPTRQANMDGLWRAARFRRAERRLEDRVPVHTLDTPCLLPLILNPNGAPAGAAGAQESGGGYDAERLLQAIPVTHPSHTRAMVEALASQVVGSIRGLDLQRLVDALLRRAADLPDTLRREIERLRDYLRERLLAPWEALGQWACQLFAILVLILTLANAIAPDNAFAKGAAGLGHSSVSRGLGSGRAGEGSFGRGGTFNGGGEAAPTIHVTGRGFRSRYGRSEATDIYGNPYQPRVFHYYGGGSHGGGGGNVYVGNAGSSPAPPTPEEHKSLFVADDDLLVLDNGDVVITLSDTAFLVAAQGTLTLNSNDGPDTLLDMNPDPNLFAAITADLQGQKQTARREIDARRDWLAWVGWTAPLFASVSDDQAEVRNLEDLDRRLTAALARIGQPPPGATPTVVTPDQAEMFVGCLLLPDNRAALRGADGHWHSTDGRTITSDAPRAKSEPCSPALTAALRSVMLKLQKEFTADVASDDNDLRATESDRASLENDLREYQSLYAANGYDSSYEVDYGTDEIPVSDALSRTQTDLQSNTADHDQIVSDRARATGNLDRLAQALQGFGPR